MASIPTEWRNKIKCKTEKNIFLDDNQVYISCKQCTIPVKLLKSKKVYSALCATTTACSGEKRLEINIEGKNNWKDACKVMYDSTIKPHLREFQFKLLHNYLPLNDKLYKWKISECFRCSYCFISAESPCIYFAIVYLLKIYI